MTDYIFGIGPERNWWGCLSTKGQEIAARWPLGPCRALFEALAEESIDDLIALCRSDCLEPCDLTFAAETLGREAEEHFRKVSASNTLVYLLNHKNTVVREGALYGLYYLLGLKDNTDDFDCILKEVARKDPSATIRKIANNLLEYTEE